MRIPWLQFDETGVFVIGTGHAPEVPPGAVALPTGMDPATFAGHYLEGGLLVPRPRLAPPVPRAGGGYTLPGCPGATVILVQDLTGGETMAQITPGAGDWEFDLPDPGTYEIEAVPPRPWFPAIYRMEIR